MFGTEKWKFNSLKILRFGRVGEVEGGFAFSHIDLECVSERYRMQKVFKSLVDMARQFNIDWQA